MQRSARPGTTPHPVLRKYYDDEGQRQPFVTALFDRAARHYERVCDLGSLGSSRFYRGWILRRSGLRKGMTLLDVATGTGPIARSAVQILGTGVVGVDPSAGMLAEARRTVAAPLVRGQAESLPFRDARFDFVTIGYALRHVADLDVTFREFVRVLKPGGCVLVLEISRPRSRALAWILRVHLQAVVPALMRVLSRAHVRSLMHYYWDTIAQCVPPETILDVMRRSGLTDVERQLRGGLLSEYIGVKPRPANRSGDSTDRSRDRVDAAQAVPSEQAEKPAPVR